MKQIKIWQYWEGYEQPFIRRAHESVQAWNNNATIIRQFDPGFDISHIIVQHRADMARLFFLYHFGGIWIDSDCICLRDLSFLEQELGDFDLLVPTEVPHCFGKHVIPNAFIVAKPRSPLLREAISIAQQRVLEAKSGSELRWGEIGADLLTELMDKYRSSIRFVSWKLVFPIPFTNPGAYMYRRTDSGHRTHLNNEAYVYMLYNTAWPFLKTLTDKDLLESDMFICYLYRLGTKCIKTEK